MADVVGRLHAVCGVQDLGQQTRWAFPAAFFDRDVVFVTRSVDFETSRASEVGHEAHAARQLRPIE
ncbi:hypothetical protein ACWGQQ_45280 [Bradyrhizobium sp. Lot33]